MFSFTAVESVLNMQLHHSIIIDEVSDCLSKQNILHMLSVLFICSIGQRMAAELATHGCSIGNAWLQHWATHACSIGQRMPAALATHGCSIGQRMAAALATHGCSIGNAWLPHWATHGCIIGNTWLQHWQRMPAALGKAWLSHSYFLCICVWHLTPPHPPTCPLRPVPPGRSFCTNGCLLRAKWSVPNLCHWYDMSLPHTHTPSWGRLLSLSISRSSIFLDESCWLREPMLSAKICSFKPHSDKQWIREDHCWLDPNEGIKYIIL